MPKSQHDHKTFSIRPYTHPTSNIHRHEIQQFPSPRAPALFLRRNASTLSTFDTGTTWHRHCSGMIRIVAIGFVLVLSALLELSEAFFYSQKHARINRGTRFLVSLAYASLCSSLLSRGGES